MVLRRLAVSLLAMATPVVLIAGFVAGPAMAATYPPTPPTPERTVAPGVVYGGTTPADVTVFSVCNSDVSVNEETQQGDAFLIKVCGFVADSDVVVSVRPPHGSDVVVDTLTANDEGTVVAGPWRFEAPGVYVITFSGANTGTQGLSVGGGATRGMSAVYGDPNRAVTATFTVPAAGGTALTRTGGDGGGHSAALWGVGLVVVGAVLLLVARSRRRSSRRRRHHVHVHA